MTVFYDRRTAQYNELTGNSGDYMTVPVPGQFNADVVRRNELLNSLGYSGGHIPPMAQGKEKYPVDQTTAVVNMR